MRNRRLLVRVHRWVSMVLGAWICLIAVTGFILVFRADLERWTRPELYRHGEGPPISPDQAVAAVAAEFPDRPIGEVTMPAHNGGIYKIENESGTRGYTTFVDPATGLINGSVDDDGGFLNVTYRLHEDLMQDRIMGMDGDVFVAWLTVAWVITVVSGFIIWYWPRVKRRVKIRRHRGPFTFNIDLHKLLGVASLVPVTLVMLTGIDFAFEDQVETFWEKATPAGEEHIGGPEELESVDEGGRPLTFDQALAVVTPLYPGGDVTEISMPDEDEPTGTVEVSVTQGWDPRRGMLGEAGTSAWNSTG